MTGWLSGPKQKTPTSHTGCIATSVGNSKFKEFHFALDVDFILVLLVWSSMPTNRGLVRLISPRHAR
jgi:hypothetical protein